MVHGNLFQRSHGRALPNHRRRARQQRDHPRAFLPFGGQCLRQQCRIEIQGPDGKQCCSWTRGMLQRTHVVAGEHRYCGKEFKRKLEQGPVGHEVEFKCKVYESGRVVAGPETLRQLANLSERQIRAATGVRSRHDPRDAPWRRCEAFDIREDDYLSERKRARRHWP
jgi:hypothetical protein